MTQSRPGRIGAGGQALVAVAVLLPLGLLPVAAFAIEASQLTTRAARLQQAADQVAEDAAQQVDVGALRAGAGLGIDPARAADLAGSELATLEPGAAIDQLIVTGATLTLRVHEDAGLFTGTVIGRGPITLRVAVTARLRPGFSAPFG